MARNGSGTYSKVNTFVSGQSITASGHNANWDDLVTEMTNSVAADGQTTITGALKGANGSNSAPAYGFASDSNTGLYRAGADNPAIAAGGTKILDITTTGASITGTLAATSDFAINTSKFTVAGSSGNTAVAGTLAVTGNTTLTGVALGADGTKTAPGYGFSGDTDTGIYRIGSNNIGVSCGDTKILDINSSGLTVAGGLNPSNSLLVQSGTVTVPNGSISNAALAAPGGLVRLTKVSANNSATSLSITSGIDSTYRVYIFEIDNLLHATDNSTFSFQVNVSGFQTSNYLCSGVETTGSTVATVTSTVGGIMCSANGASNTTASGGWSGRIALYNPAGTASYKMFTIQGGYMKQGDAVLEGITSSGFYKGGTGAVTQIRVLSASGNIVSGNITMYGLTDS